MSSIIFKYGDYEFNPKPLFNISVAPIKTPDGIGYGKDYTISLEGDLLNTGNQIDSGIVSLFNKINNLNDALSQDGRLLLISCDTTPILSGYPTIESLNIERQADNYTRHAKYTADFKLPTLIAGPSGDKFNGSGYNIPPFIESCNETWDIEFQDERLPFSWTLNSGNITEKFGYKIAVTHNIDVKARIGYTGIEVYNDVWKDAKDYAETKLGFDNEIFTLSGILSLPGTTYFTKYDTFNNYRQVSIDKSNGNIKITETFIVTPSGQNSLPNNAIETFEISTSQNEGILTVGIQGEIEGLSKISYTGYGSNNGYYVTSSKFAAASGYFNKIKSRMYNRANTIYKASVDECFSKRPLSKIIKQRTIGFNPIQGRISYDYQFDNTPTACITGNCILSQSITIDDTYPHDVYASQTILGRAAGPILQDIGTITNANRGVNIEIVTLPPTGCGTLAEIYKPVPTGQIEAFIAAISGDLMNNYSQVFVDSSSQSWNFTVGRYTRSISFAYTNCDAPV